MNDQPNILLIVLDTLRRDRLSIYGAPRDTSPAFDAFAADGALYTRAIAPAQWTVPAHASIFTGTYPGEHGVLQSASRLPDSLPTAAEHLRGAGYHTVAFCNNPLVGVLDNGLQRGFDQFYNYASAVPHTPRDRNKSWLRREVTRRFRPTARRIGNQFARSDTLFRIALRPAFVPIWSRVINFKGNTAASTRDLIDYLAEYRAGGSVAPWFAFVNLMGAHLPYQPPQEYLAKIEPSLVNDRRAYAFVRAFNADGAAWASPPEPPLLEWQQAALLAFYDAEIAYQDAQLGRVLDALKASGDADHTTVIVLADHGEGHGEHNLFGHGFNAHAELVHVPMAISGERFPHGARIEENTSTRRLFSTLLHLGGVEATAQTPDPARESLAAAETEAAVFSESFAVSTFLNVLEHRSTGASVIDRMHLRDTRRAVYAGDHKLITRAASVRPALSPDDGFADAEGEPLRAEALYDIAQDPAETRDLLSSQPERAAELLALAQRLMHSGTHAGSETPAYREDDERVLEHLRMLGYIE